MKSILTFLLFVGSLSLFGQTLNTKQTTLVIKKTADWCPFCGTYGWSYFKGLNDQVQSDPNALLVSMHFSGGLQNTAAQQITNNFDAPGQPVFIVNNTDILVESNNFSAKINETKSTIQSNNAKPAAIALGLNLYKISASKYTINVVAKSSQALNGIESFVGFYRVRNNVIHNQASLSSTASHINVLEASLIPGSIWGQALFTGSFPSGTEVQFNQEIDAFEPNANIKILAIVWNKQPNGKYSFINGQMISSSELTTSNRDVSIESPMDVKVLNGSLEISWPGHKIDACMLINPLGQAQRLQARGTAGVYELPIVPTGTYYVSVTSGKAVRSKTVLIQE